MKQITARKKKCVLLSAVLAVIVVLTLWAVAYSTAPAAGRWQL